MAISKHNRRVMIIMPNDLLDKIKDKANKETRSISNYIVAVLKEKLESKDN